MSKIDKLWKRALKIEKELVAREERLKALVKRSKKEAI